LFSSNIHRQQRDTLSGTSNPESLACRYYLAQRQITNVIRLVLQSVDSRTLEGCPESSSSCCAKFVKEPSGRPTSQKKTATSLPAIDKATLQLHLIRRACVYLKPAPGVARLFTNFRYVRDQ